MKLIVGFRFIPMVLLWIYFPFNEIYAQKLETQKIEELPKLQSQELRSVFILLTAEWCTYCKNIELTSFQDEEVVKMLNTHFYTVIFDIESINPVFLYGQEFKYKSTGLDTGIHEFAELIGTIDGLLSTPTIVLFDNNLRIKHQYNGYLNKTQIIELIKLEIN